MDYKPCRATFKTEKERLAIYQHQHRGIKFKKFYLFPTVDREINLVGQDDHVYRGRIPRISEDQLPPEVDEASLDEEKLYKEINNVNFPPVPQQEPLGPTRRVEGAYTLQKRMVLAPIKVELGEDQKEYQILGRDGGIYRGRGRQSSQLELDKQLRGTKRSVYKKRQQSKSAGIIEPSLITLQGINQISAGTAIEVKIPVANLRELTAIIKKQSKEADEKNKVKDETQETAKSGNKSEKTKEQTKTQITDASNENDDKKDNIDEEKAEEKEGEDEASGAQETAEQDDSNEAEEAPKDESAENEESDDEDESPENEETDDTADADESPENEEDTADSPEDDEQEDTTEEKEEPEQESSDNDS